MGKRLKRSSYNRVLAGVCGGLGGIFQCGSYYYSGVVWVLLAFMPGCPGLIAYLILALLIPSDNGMSYQYEDNSYNTKNTPIFIAIAPIVVGTIMLAKIILPQYFLDSSTYSDTGQYY